MRRRSVSGSRLDVVRTRPPQPRVRLSGEMEHPQTVGLGDLAELAGQDVTVPEREGVDRVELTRTAPQATGPATALARIGR